MFSFSSFFVFLFFFFFFSFVLHIGYVRKRLNIGELIIHKGQTIFFSCLANRRRSLYLFKLSSTAGAFVTFFNKKGFRFLSPFVGHHGHASVKLGWWMGLELSQALFQLSIKVHGSIDILTDEHILCSFKPVDQMKPKWK